jgi:hypothetical protein
LPGTKVILTTALSLSILGVSDFKGFSEFGIISAVVLSTTLLAMFLALPGILCLGISALALGLSIFLQVQGMFDKFFRFCGRLPLPLLQRLVETHLETVKKLDTHLDFLYRNAKGKLVAAFILQYSSRLLKVGEVYIILRVIGIPVSFGDAFFLTAMMVVVNTIFFLLPGQWGVSEAAQVLLLQNIGVTAPAGTDLAASGLGLAVIRRIRKLLFALIGIVFFYGLPGAATGSKQINPTKPELSDLCGD